MTKPSEKLISLNRLSVVVTIISTMVGLVAWLIWLGVEVGENKQRVAHLEEWRKEVSESMVTQRELKPQLDAIQKALDRIDTKVDQIWRNPDKSKQ